MEKLALGLRIQADEAGLWLEEAGRRLQLPVSFWHALAGALRDGGQPELAQRLERAIRDVQERQVRAEAKFRCMEGAYSPDEARRCQALLADDLKNG